MKYWGTKIKDPPRSLFSIPPVVTRKVFVAAKKKSLAIRMNHTENIADLRKFKNLIVATKNKAAVAVAGLGWSATTT